MSGLSADYLIGGIVACWVYLVGHDSRPRPAGRPAAVITTLASMTYTLYLVHMPPLVFASAHLVPAGRWPLGPAVVGCLVALAATVLAYAWWFARLTEAHTDAVRRALTARPVRPEAEG